MSREQIEKVIAEVLEDIAPEVDFASIPHDVPLREELDIDSMDFLNFITGLHKALNVEIPEQDYGKLDTLEHCIEYLEAKISS